MISDLGGFTPPTFVGQHHVCWITIPMFSAEFYGCICIHRCCCEAMCFPWQTYQFLLVKQKLTHFPNFSWYKLFKTLKNIWFSDFPMIFPFFPWFSHDFPRIFMVKTHHPPVPSDPPRTLAPAPWIWQRRRAAAGASGWWRCCWRPWRIRMLEPLETWFGYLPYIYIYNKKHIYTYK